MPKGNHNILNEAHTVRVAGFPVSPFKDVWERTGVKGDQLLAI